MQGGGGAEVLLVSRFTEEVAALNSGPGTARGESPAGGGSAVCKCQRREAAE